MAKRRRNPINTKMLLVGVGAGLGGLLLGYAIAGSGRRNALAVGGEWSYWVVEDTTSFSRAFVPYIRSPGGQVFALSGEITQASAEWAAEEAIRERGGTPVKGQPV